MQTVVATANVQKDMSRDAAAGALWDVLVEGPDIIGLQEWGSSRNVILDGVKNYRWARSTKGGGPILYGDRYGLLRTHGRVLARRSFIGHLIGRKSTLPASIAGEFILHDDQTGFDLAVINFHLTAEVQYAGKYRTDKAHAPRVRRHKREVRKLAKIAARHKAKGRDVLLLGDTNFDGLVLAGVLSCWVGHETPGTLGKRTVDMIYAESPSKAVKRIRTGSDHAAVIATYV